MEKHGVCKGENEEPTTDKQAEQNDTENGCTKAKACGGDTFSKMAEEAADAAKGKPNPKTV